MKNHTVRIETEDGVETHYTSHDGNYATLCGMDGNDADSSCHQKTLGQGRDVSCRQCILIVDHVKVIINQPPKGDV